MAINLEQKERMEFNWEILYVDTVKKVKFEIEGLNLKFISE